VNNTPGLAHRKVLQIRNASGTAAVATHVHERQRAGDDFNNPGTHNRRGGAWAARLVCGNNNDIRDASMLAELSSALYGRFIHSNSCT